jgi:hypothetical protein
VPQVPLGEEFWDAYYGGRCTTLSPEEIQRRLQEQDDVDFEAEQEDHRFWTGDPRREDGL